MNGEGTLAGERIGLAVPGDGDSEPVEGVVDSEVRAVRTEGSECARVMGGAASAAPELRDLRCERLYGDLLR